LVEHVLGKKKPVLGHLVYDDLIARGKKVKTARRWRSWVNRFEACCGAKREYDRSDVIRYLSWMRQQGFSDDSTAVMLRPVRLLAQVQGWRFPRLALPKVRDSDVRRPVFSYREVCEIIERGKHVLSERELAYLALATTYGLRREELADLKVGDGVVTVDTVKGGVVTTHRVPEAIKPYVAGYRPAGITYLSLVFRRMISKLGLVGREGYGWHSIRRALVTELVSCEAPLLSVLRFMRWSNASLKGQFGMVAIYAVHNQADIDESIFQLHPFLPVWRNEVRGERSESIGTSPLTSGEVAAIMKPQGVISILLPPILGTSEKPCAQNPGHVDVSLGDNPKFCGPAQPPDGWRRVAANGPPPPSNLSSRRLAYY